MKMKFVNDFKQFAMRGNVVDMAVGIITVSYTHLTLPTKWSV